VRVRRFVFVLLAFAAAFAMPAATAGAASPTKPYRVTLSPESVSAGVTIDAFTITLTNETGTQQLGSSNVDVPGDLTIIGDPTLDAPAVARGATVSLDPNRRNRLLLRNLNLPPNASVTVTLGLRMTCVASSPTNTYTWSFETKQSNDFNGPPGNALGPILGSLTTEVTGHCALRFVAQPGDARKDDQIRADDFGGLESSNYVSVEAIDGSADRSGPRSGWTGSPARSRSDSYRPAAGSPRALLWVTSPPDSPRSETWRSTCRASTTSAPRRAPRALPRLTRTTTTPPTSRSSKSRSPATRANAARSFRAGRRRARSKERSVPTPACCCCR
jgi:hypothetical protein